MKIEGKTESAWMEREIWVSTNRELNWGIWIINGYLNIYSV